MNTVPKTDLRRQNNWRDVFALDLRSLAVLRISFGLIILADLVFRLSTLTELYTDSGYMTRELAAKYYQFTRGGNWWFSTWSVYWIFGEAWWYYTLFGVAALLAVMLLLGYRTRLATLGSWVLLVSLHTANPLTLTSGDTILRLSLFWSIFLPLGQLWSMDARGKPNLTVANRDSPTNQNVVSIASACFIIQLIIMYFSTGIAKCNDVWFSGQAMEYVFRLDIYVLPMGKTLLQYPALLKFTAYVTLFAEVILIWCLLIPWRNGIWRGIVMATFIGFHIAIALTLDIGLFSIICIAIWIALTPTAFWSALSKSLKTDSAADIRYTRARGIGNLAASVFCGLTLVYTILTNLSNFEATRVAYTVPPSLASYGHVLSLDQRFQMFGQPPRFSPWFVYEGTMNNGKFVDPMQRPPIAQTNTSNELHQAAQSDRSNLRSFHWRKVHRNLVYEAMTPFRAELAEYAVRKWNSENSDSEQIVHLKVYCYFESTDPQVDDSFEQSSIWGTFGIEQQKEKALETKVDSILNQLLDEENPNGLSF